jgi:restriction endonuclease S subunit
MMSWSHGSRYTAQTLSSDMPRIDFEWVDPRHERMERRLRSLASKRGYLVDYMADICSSIFNGVTGEEYLTSGVPILKLRNITDGGLNWDTDFVLKRFYEENPDSHVHVGDILANSTGEGTIGRVAIVDREGAMIAVDVIALRTNEKILPSFLLHYLRSVFGQMQFERFTVGSTGQTHLRNINRFLVIYPKAKAEQREKVKEADRLMAKAVEKRVEYLREKREAIIPFADESSKLHSSQFFLRQLSPSERRLDLEYHDPRHARLGRQIESLVNNGFLKDTVGGLCDIFTGKTADAYVSTGIPIIKVRNVTSEGIDWDTDFVIRQFYEENADLHLTEGDILLTTTGEGTIGRIDMLDKARDCMTDGHVTILRIKKERAKDMLPRYLKFYLRSFFAQAQFERFTVGSTGQTELNDPDLANVLVVYPKPIKEQARLGDLANAHEESFLKAKAEYSQSVEASKAEFVKSLGIE